MTGTARAAVATAVALIGWHAAIGPRTWSPAVAHAGAAAGAATRTPEATPAGDVAWLRARLAGAPAGAVIDIPAGDYRGNVVIDRPLHLRGMGHVILRGDGTTHVVAVRAPDVVLENLEVRGSGMDLTKDHAGIHVTGARVVIRHVRIADCLHGIYVRQADGARIEDSDIVGRPDDGARDPLPPGPDGPGAGETCEVPLDQNARGNGIHLWNSRGHVIARNVIRGTRDGIYFSFVDDADVSGNVITGVRYGLHYMYSDGNRFERNVFRDDAAGAALMYSKGITLRDNRFEANRGRRAYGLLLQSVDDTRVERNRIAGNTLGLYAENSHGNEVRDNRITDNHVGLRISDSSDGNVFAGNTFSGNVHAVETSGTNVANRWSDAGRGNYWDGAARLDLDGNGIGDLPHREVDLFGALRRGFPEIGLLAGSPGERLLRFVHARIGVPGLSGVVDPAPLVREDGR
ncbi:MAG: NosD domain-containing protein [Vicinamibacterales bacterium]